MSNRADDEENRKGDGRTEPLGPLPEEDAPVDVHDKIFKIIFGEPTRAAVVLREALPAPLVLALDWDRLKPGQTVVQGADLREGTRDLLFKTTLKSVAPSAGEPDGAPHSEVEVDLIFEHASRPRRRLRLRLNGYIQRGWEDAERRPRAEPREPLPLPVILPVVLHQGPRPWTIPSLVDLCELPPGLAARVAPFMPAFDVAFFDLALWPRSALQSLPAGLARLALVALQAARTDADLIALLASMSEDIQAAYRAGSHGTLAELFSYTARVRGERPDAEYFEKVRRATRPADQEAVMSGYMLLSELCEAQGRIAQARETLSQLLGLRFPAIPAELLARVAEASLEDVKRWTGRVLVATTPEAVFAPPE